MPRTRHTATFALITVAAVVLTACGSGDPAAAPAGPPPPRAEIPTQDVVSSVKKNKDAAALLPADVRASGTLTIASGVGTPPGATHLPDGRTVAGTDIDVADAVARALG